MTLFRSVMFLSLGVSLVGYSSELIPPPVCPMSHGYSASLRHLEPQGIGYNQGYTTLDLFLTDVAGKAWVPLLDLRLHVFNDGRPAFNAGLGVRYTASEYVFGIEGYYDYRRTSHGRYNQFCLGLEALGNTLDFRISGYFPFSTQKVTWYAWEGGRLNFYQEDSFPGVSGEVGGRIECTSYADLYLAAGPYYFSASKEHAAGGEMRARLTLFEHFFLEVEGSYDPLFHGIVQGQLGLQLSFGPKPLVRQDPQRRSCLQRRHFQERALQKVARQEIIVIHSKLIESSP